MDETRARQKVSLPLALSHRGFLKGVGLGMVAPQCVGACGREQGGEMPGRPLVQWQCAYDETGRIIEEKTL
ncbi:MAG: hypothetical protein HYZ81_25620 [Nitrospinae bacterium]|nr:hypothetical protein [Nitrospinota bacterium]